MIKAIASSGDFFKIDDFQISNTIGECAVLTSAKIFDFQITEGFQQGEIIQPIPQVKTITIFPNPVTDKDHELIYILPPKDEVVTYYLYVYSLQGKLLANKSEIVQLIQKEGNFDFSLYPRGLYFLNIQTSDGELYKSFKIERQ